MDYSSKANSHMQPWSRDLSDGDVISTDQAGTIDKTRLMDFGLTLLPRRAGGYRVVEERWA
jgi:hypothetical protein